MAMFPENEFPELSDSPAPNEENKPETVSSDEADTDPTPNDENPVQEETTETPVQTPADADPVKTEDLGSAVEEVIETAGEPPSVQENTEAVDTPAVEEPTAEEGQTEEPVASVKEEESADTEPTTKVEEPPAEPEEAPAEKDSPAEAVPQIEGVAHISLDEGDEEPEEEDHSLPEGEVKPALLEELQTLSKDPATRNSTLQDYTAVDYILAIHHFFQAEDILAESAKVRIVKRSFDALDGDQTPDPVTVNRFRTALSKFNKKKAEFQQLAEAAKASNTEKKKELLVQLKAIVDKNDALLIREVREIQEAWKSIGHVLRHDFEAMTKEYRGLLDSFYQNRTLYFQMLDYDRQKNLQEKEKLIEEAENLIPAEEERENLDVWREKMDLFQSLQKKWKSVGHVPREDMDRINSAYRGVIDRFFEVRHGFMEIQDTLRQENATKKQEILAQMEPFATFESGKPREWNDATNQLREHQEAWKQIGQAPQNINGELWAKYREICNQFFSHKSAFFKGLDTQRAENLVKKRELVERAEALKDGDEWEKSAKELKHLQREWKEIGPVPERHSNKLWHRFRQACDQFFEARRTHYSHLHEGENENLEAKKALIEEVKKLDIAELGSPQAGVEAIKKIQARWKEVGRVPYKFKDSIWDEFRAAIDAFFNGLSVKRGEQRSMRMKADIGSISNDDDRSRTIKTKISRIRRQIHAARENVDQYSNNILFIAKGKSGDPLRKQIQNKIDQEKRQIEEWKKQIRGLDEMLQNPPKEEEPEPETPAEEAPSEKAATTETPAAKGEKTSEETPPAEETPTQEVAEPEAPVTAETAPEKPAEETHTAAPEKPAEEPPVAAEAKAAPASEPAKETPASEDTPVVEEASPSEETPEAEPAAESQAAEETPATEEEAPKAEKPASAEEEEAPKAEAEAPAETEGDAAEAPAEEGKKEE
jgi:hypothetical protein